MESKTPDIEQALTFKVVVAGSRSFTDYTRLCQICDTCLSRKSDVAVISGGAQGADALGERYARDRGHIIILRNADWSDIHRAGAVVKTNARGQPYDALAGFRRNAGMAAEADALIAFWDGHSPGTKHMIDCMRRQNKPVRIYRVDLGTFAR